MTSAASLVAWAYDAKTKGYNPERVDWLLQQRDSLVATQFGGGQAASSLINAAGSGKTAGFQIDLSGPAKLQVISDALEIMGMIPDVACAVTTTYPNFEGLEH